MEKLLEAETFVPGRNAQVQWGKSDWGLPPFLGWRRPDEVT